MCILKYMHKSIQQYTFPRSCLTQMVFALGRKGQFLIVKYVLKGQLLNFGKDWWFKHFEIFSKWGLFLCEYLSRFFWLWCFFGFLLLLFCFLVFLRHKTTNFPVWFLANEFPVLPFFYVRMFVYFVVILFSQSLLRFICVECVSQYVFPKCFESLEIITTGSNILKCLIIISWLVFCSVWW